MWKFWKKPKHDPWHIPRRIRLEHAERLLGGLPTRSDHPSVLFFTVHKAASSFVGRMLQRIAVKHQINPIDYEEYLNSERAGLCGHGAQLVLESVLREADLGEAPSCEPLAAGKPYELARLFPASGFHFGPIRKPTLLRELPNLERYRVMIQLRDPRDCLTSMYFSQAFSHVAPRDPGRRKRFLEDRLQAREESIDEYVLQRAPGWLNDYRLYAEALQNHPHLRLVKYEDMVLKFPRWLNTVEQTWNFEFDPAIRRELIEQADFDVKQEDVNSHKRQVLPGDHLRKLKPDTVRRLTDLFAPELESFGYPLGASDARAA